MLRAGVAAVLMLVRRLAKITWRLLEIGAILESRGKCSHTGDTGEVRRAGCIAQREDTTALGCGGGTGARARWNRAGGRGDGTVENHDRAQACGNSPKGGKTRTLRAGCAIRAQAASRCRVHDAGLVVALEKLVDPATRGDPMGPLRWTCSSAALLARELQAAGQQVSERSVNRLLHELGYSLQANRKTLEGRQHPDRDAQFNHINRQVKAFQRQRQPVVSVALLSHRLSNEGGLNLPCLVE